LRDGGIHLEIKNEIYDDMVKHRYDDTSEKAILDMILSLGFFSLSNFGLRIYSRFSLGGRSDQREGVKACFYVHVLWLKREILVFCVSICTTADGIVGCHKS
jgi:hypothetical protein